MANNVEDRLGRIEANLERLSKLLSSSEGLGTLVTGTEVTEDWDVYPVRVTNLPPQGTYIQSIIISSQGHFDLVKITAVVVPSSLIFELRIQDGNSGRYLTNQGAWVRSDNICGTPQLPYMILGKRRFLANSDMIIEFRNPSTTETITLIELALHGIKVFV